MNRIDLEKLFDELFPLHRSISGNGLRKSLDIISGYIPLQRKEYKTGKKCFDWMVPAEWNINDAYIRRKTGESVVEYRDSNLHVMSYSEPISGRMGISALKEHIHTLPHKPDAIPFVTSYYKRNWGFCMTQKTLDSMNDDEYDVMIDSKLKPGSVSAGELYIKGRSKKEVIFFSHIGHPSMANDQLSGPVTLVGLASGLLKREGSFKYSYRFILAPESIGSIAYISENKGRLKRRCIGGYTVVCTADSANLTYRMSKSGNSETDLAMKNTLIATQKDYSLKPFSSLGCDERHFNSHGIGIPMGSIMRSSPGTYPEYHTSLDDRDFISFQKLEETIEFLDQVVDNLENDCRIYAKHKNCEPKLDKYGLYPSTGNRNIPNSEVEILLTIWQRANGIRLCEVADDMGMNVSEVRTYADKLAGHGIISIRGI